jgi:hypothetical protein
LDKRSAKNVNKINENSKQFTNEITIIKLNSSKSKRKTNRYLNTSLSIINKNELDAFDNKNTNIEKSKSISMMLTKKILSNNNQSNVIESKHVRNIKSSVDCLNKIDSQKRDNSNNKIKAEQEVENVKEKSNKKLTTLIKVDTSRSRTNYDVIRMCLNELGWQDCPNGFSNGCDIVWQSCASSNENNDPSSFSYAKNIRINKFPCMNQLLRKGPLSLSLNIMRKIYGQEYDFYPRTWFLPVCKFIHCYLINN